MENYGTRLKEARKNRGYTQAEIAKIMNVPQQNWQRYESGVLDLKMSTICRFCVPCYGKEELYKSEVPAHDVVKDAILRRTIDLQ